MPTQGTPYRKDVYDLILPAIVDGLKEVQKAIDERKYIGHYHNFPKLEGFEKSGFPHFLQCYSGAGPLEYKGLFGFAGLHSAIPQDKLYFDKIDSCRAIPEF